MFTTHWGEHMEQFEGLDFYDIESLLTEEEICLLYTSPSPRDDR